MGAVYLHVAVGEHHQQGAVGQLAREVDQHVQRAKRTGVAYDDYIANAGKNIPVGRMGKPEEFARLATLLVSDANGFVAGTAINVDGGASPVW